MGSSELAAEGAGRLEGRVFGAGVSGAGVSGARVSGAGVSGAGVSGAGLHVFLVCSRFNDLVTAELLSGAIEGLLTHGVASRDVDLAWVPGAFELPIVSLRAARSGRYDAVIALGAVIRGETGHYDLVAGQCAAGIARAGLDSGIPVIFGVLTTDNLEQALQRAGGTSGNKGLDAALAAIEMANLLRELP